MALINFREGHPVLWRSRSNFFSCFLILTTILVLSKQACAQDSPSGWAEKFDLVLQHTRPLEHARGNRLPLYLWPAIDPGPLKDEEAEVLVRELNDRGIALFGAWKKNDRESSLNQALTVALAQQKLNLRVNINAISHLYSFYNGDKATAHIDDNGNRFFDDSFGRKQDMGCPFAIDFRKKQIREELEYFLDRYRSEGLEVDFIFADWEVDGPLEVNSAFASSKKCVRCRKHLEKDFDFETFQKTMRDMRSYLQHYAFSQPVLERFPNALVGNYGVYPHDGFRYWYDYFEQFQEPHPYVTDQRAKYRKWYQDFPATGFTYAMPVAYTWGRIFHWYDFEPTDYRWFYNMLKVASNAGMSTPHQVPVITWVHWNTIHFPNEPDPEIVQFSKENYQELLWHMLFRGTDTFAMWCMESEYAQEVSLVQEVYAQAQQYGDFLDHGVPITFELPKEPGVVISGLMYKDRILVRRTDFGKDRQPVTVLAGTTTIEVPSKVGNQVIHLNE